MRLIADLIPNAGRTLEANGGVGGVGNYVNASDAHYKTDVETIGGTLEKVTRMRGVSFDWLRAEFPEVCPSSCLAKSDWDAILYP